MWQKGRPIFCCLLLLLLPLFFFLLFVLAIRQFELAAYQELQRQPASSKAHAMSKLLRHTSTQLLLICFPGYRILQAADELLTPCHGSPPAVAALSSFCGEPSGPFKLGFEGVLKLLEFLQTLAREKYDFPNLVVCLGLFLFIDSRILMTIS
ncbi:hypothetical protein CRG98_036627 [Punica granatum]|uniref:Uncharacterized protein n=1 Tax=Punica granatum TaxID=22663 RepID=A0A2I0IG51_PUNGR|nr:hypothetical protein CRG98_036627 [Punica granatum]